MCVNASVSHHTVHYCVCCTVGVVMFTAEAWVW